MEYRSALCVLVMVLLVLRSQQIEQILCSQGRNRGYRFSDAA